MAGAFSVRALGKGSVASFMKVALDIVWIVLLIAAGCLAIGAIACVAIVILMQTGALPADLFESDQASVNIGPVTVETSSQDRLLAPMIAPAFLAATVAIGGSLVIVLRLKRLFKNFTSGEPFSADNASHLRVIWITMLVMELSRYVIAGAVAVLVTVLGQPETTEIHVEAPVNLMTWGAIFILIVLAEVFREGARLKQEQELTI